MSKFLKPILNNLPEELIKLNQWVNWKEEIDKNGEPTKPLYTPQGYKASHSDSLTWSSFEAVKKAVSRFDGLGFVVSGDDPYVGIDFDDCRSLAFDGIDNESAKELASGFDMIKPDVAEHIKKLNSYTEVSPSRKGIRVFVKGKLPVPGRRKGNFEVYQNLRYLTLTGHIVEGCPRTIEERQTQLDEFYKAVFGEKDNVYQSRQNNLPPSDTPINWNERLDKAFQSRKKGTEIRRLYDGDTSGYPSASEADLALCCHLAFWMSGDPISTDTAYRASKLMRPKWDEKHFSDGKTYGQETIRKALSGCTEFYQEPIIPIAEPLTEEDEQKPDFLPFPSGIMSGLAGNIADAYSSIMEAPDVFFYFAALTNLGNLFGNKVTLQSEISPQPRLYTLLIGDTDDKKTTAIKTVTTLFLDTLTNFPLAFGLNSAEGLQKLLSTQSNLLLVFDEFRAFMNKAKLDNSVLLPAVGTLFELTRYESATKDRHIKMENVYLSMLAASTVDTFHETWDKAFTHIGFINRLLIIPGHGSQRFSIPQRIDATHKRELQRQLGEVITYGNRINEYTLTSEAFSLYDDWYKTIDRSSVYSKRLDTYALRLMILLALNDKKPIIDCTIVQKIIDLANWQFQVRRYYSPIDADNEIAKMEEKIRRILSTAPQTVRNIKRAVHTERTGLGIYNKAWENLVKAKEIQNTGGSKWQLSP